MATSSLVKCIAMTIMCIVMVAPLSEALNCGQVSGSLGSCIAYLKGSPGPSPACCGGIRKLSGLAKTLADRKTACNCLVSASKSIPGINFGLASGLPGKCGVSIPYVISPRTNCATIG